jgi:hypothetical protein
MEKPKVTEAFPETDCPICLVELGKVNVVTIECGHTFHFSCLNQILNDNCPKCRQPFASKKVEPRMKQPISNSESYMMELKYGGSLFEQLAEVDILPERFRHLQFNNGIYHITNSITISMAEICRCYPFFELPNRWGCLSKEFIFFMLTQSENNEVLKSKNSNVNGISDLYYLDYCLSNFTHLNDITELLECAMSYNKLNNADINKLRYPSISELIKKPIQDSTLIKLLETPEIKQQLQYPEIFDKCRDVLLKFGLMPPKTKCQKCECELDAKDSAHKLCDKCFETEIPLVRGECIPDLKEQIKVLTGEHIFVRTCSICKSKFRTDKCNMIDPKCDKCDKLMSESVVEISYKVQNLGDPKNVFDKSKHPNKKASCSIL